MSISVRISTETSSSPVVLPCSPVLLTACKRSSLPSLLPRSRSLLLQSASTLSGSEVPSWPLSPPSNRCGSPRRSTTSLDLPSSIASAFKLISSKSILKKKKLKKKKKKKRGGVLKKKKKKKKKKKIRRLFLPF